MTKKDINLLPRASRVLEQKERKAAEKLRKKSRPSQKLAVPERKDRKPKGFWGRIKALFGLK